MGAEVEVELLNLVILEWFMLVFLISGLIVNFVQLLITPLRLICLRLHRTLNAHLAYLILSPFTFLSEWWGNFDIVLYGQQADYEMMGQESWIILSNHYSDVDFIIGWVLAGRSNILKHLKSFVKHSHSYIPIIGWCWRMSDFGFVKRNWSEDQSGFLATCDALKKYHVPFWIGIMPEGTRCTEEKLAASQKYALENGIKPLKYHLLPRSRGLAEAVKQMHMAIPAICEMELALDDPENATFYTLLNRGTIKAHLFIRRIPMESVPKDTIEETSVWCKQLFREKDALQEYFHHHGRFEAPIITETRPRNMKNLLTFCMLNVAVMIFVLIILQKLMLTIGVAKVVVAIIITMVTAFLALNRMLRETQSGKGSEFGLKKEK